VSDAANGTEEDGVFRLGHRSAGVRAGGTYKAKQHVGTVFKELFGIGRGLGGFVAVVQLAQLKIPAGVVLAGR
jgi:hypothetical protein